MESFSYDHLNRLSRSQVTGCPAVNVAYSRNGNIETKTGLGDYAYASARPNAVTSVANSANLIPSFRQDITYTPFSKTASISENDYELTFDYGYAHLRKTSSLKYSGTLLKKMYYAGNYEYEELTNRKVHYIAGPDGLVCIAVINGNAPAEYYYAYKDHLGSLLTLTDGSGNVVAEQNFDAWGRSRNAADWTYTGIPSAPDWLYRGFTGHEHLPEFALINMNGRMYDPVLSRMLRPDNFVQDPFGTQGYNRYSYAWNNPLSYTDPNGEFIQYIIGAIVGGIVGTISGHKAGLRGWELFGFAMMNAGIGAATAGIGTSVSASVSAALPATMSAAASGAISGMAAGAVSGFVGGFYGTVVSNAFGVSNADPFKAGLIGMGMGAGIGAATGAISGGIQNVKQGKTFWRGDPSKKGTAFYLRDGKNQLSKEYYDNLVRKVGEERANGITSSSRQRLLERIDYDLNNPIGLDAYGDIPQSRSFDLHPKVRGMELSYRGSVPTGETVTYTLDRQIIRIIPSGYTPRYQIIPGLFDGRNLTIGMTGQPIIQSETFGIIIRPSFDTRILIWR